MGYLLCGVFYATVDVAFIEEKIRNSYKIAWAVKHITVYDMKETEGDQFV